MRIGRRGTAAVAIALVLMGACGGDDAGSQSDRTDEVSDDTDASDEATDPSDDADTGDETTVPETKPGGTKPPSTKPPSTKPPKTNPPATDAPTTLAEPKLYEEVSPPQVPQPHTAAFADSGSLDDGEYWVQYNGGEEQTPDITVYQAFFGDECEQMASDNGETCDNGIYLPEDPSRDIDDLAFADDVHLTVSDAVSQKSYRITPEELVTIRGSSPSDGAPENYSFTPFAFLMTVDDGEITRFEQIWTP